MKSPEADDNFDKIRKDLKRLIAELERCYGEIAELKGENQKLRQALKRLKD
ncbi:MAG TPA: hypothetical protein VL404_00360 [Candidatus Eisenbacteria bacterium]|jgi:hypothetical protein|nr:hypothetical protein [Candidatus Eisenbacteria bacterium]